MNISASFIPPIVHAPLTVGDIFAVCQTIVQQQRPIGSLAKYMAEVVGRIHYQPLPSEMTSGVGNKMMDDAYWPLAVRLHLDIFVDRKFKKDSVLEDFCGSFFKELLTVRFAVDARDARNVCQRQRDTAADSRSAAAASSHISRDHTTIGASFPQSVLPLEWIDNWVKDYVLMGIILTPKQFEYLYECKIGDHELRIGDHQLRTLIDDFYCVRLSVYLEKFDEWRRTGRISGGGTLELKLGSSEFYQALNWLITDVDIAQEAIDADGIDNWAAQLLASEDSFTSDAAGLAQPSSVATAHDIAPLPPLPDDAWTGV